VIDLKKPESLPQSLYWSTSYLTPKRFSSIGYQWNLAIESGGSRFLEVGPGSGMLTLMLRAKGLDVITADINSSLQPSVAVCLPALPFRSQSMDVVLCFEVLEHLPIETFLPCLDELRRVAINKLIISLPNCSPVIKEPKRYSIPWATNRMAKLVRRLPGLRKPEPRLELDPAHYWEIGDQGITPASVIAQVQQCGLKHLRNFRNPYYPYHHYFIFDLA
jgi:SAM-dependent methyltransferase